MCAECQPKEPEGLKKDRSTCEVLFSANLNIYFFNEKICRLIYISFLYLHKVILNLILLSESWTHNF